MIRNLVIITVTGLILAIVGIGGAFALGGNDLARHDWTWVVSDDGDRDSVRIQRGGEVTPDVTRTLAWDGGDRLLLDLPADVIYVQGADARVVVTGPQTAVDAIRLSNGRLVMDDDDDRSERGYIRWNRRGFHAWSDDDRLKVTVTAPSVSAFEIIGASDVSIRGYDHPALALTISGSGDVEVEGQTRTLAVEITGSGDIDADRLDVADLTVDITGSGDLRAGPTGEVQADLSGSGDVNLTRRPAQLRQTITGSGDLDEG
jgi:hypothetical protein